MLKTAVGFAHDRLVFSRRTRVLAEAIAGLVPPGSDILDVGAGDGRIASLVAGSVPNANVTGIDVLLRPETHIPVTVFDGETIPFSDKSHDVVTFIDVLHHTHSAPRLVSEAARVARRFVVIKDHLAETRLDHATLRAMDWVGNAPHGVALPYVYRSLSEWKTLFADAGLAAETLDTELAMYPPALNVVFGRRLHFLARLRPLT